MTIQTGLKIDASNLNCKITLVWLDSSLSVVISQKSAAQAAIHAFVNQRLDYANVLLYGLSKCVIYNLQMVQNSAARTVTGAPNREHITLVLHDLHWLPLRCRLKVFTLMYKIKNGIAPSLSN